MNGRRTPWTAERLYMHDAIRSSAGKFFETFWNALQRSVQKIIFHERGWDVGQERLAVMRQDLKEATIQLLEGGGAVFGLGKLFISPPARQGTCLTLRFGLWRRPR